MAIFSEVDIGRGGRLVRTAVTVEVDDGPPWGGLLRPPNNTGLTAGETYTISLPGHVPAAIRVTGEADQGGSVPFLGVGAPPRPSAQRRFAELAKTWKAERAVTSSMTEMLRSPSYRAIVAMGEDALLPLLRELAVEPDYWFAALHEITGEDPVPQAERGDRARMTARWLQWARQRFGETPAGGVRGFLLYDLSKGRHIFRVYDIDDKSKYVDYDIAAEEVEVTVECRFLSLRHGGRNKLDWNSALLSGKGGG